MNRHNNQQVTEEEEETKTIIIMADNTIPLPYDTRTAPDPEPLLEPGYTLVVLVYWSYVNPTPGSGGGRPGPLVAAAGSRCRGRWETYRTGLPDSVNGRKKKIPLMTPYWKEGEKKKIIKRYHQ